MPIFGLCVFERHRTGIFFAMLFRIRQQQRTHTRNRECGHRNWLFQSDGLCCANGESVYSGSLFGFYLVIFYSKPVLPLDTHTTACFCVILLSKYRIPFSQLFALGLHVCVSGALWLFFSSFCAIPLQLLIALDLGSSVRLCPLPF